MLLLAAVQSVGGRAFLGQQNKLSLAWLVCQLLARPEHFRFFFHILLTGQVLAESVVLCVFIFGCCLLIY